MSKSFSQRSVDSYTQDVGPGLRAMCISTIILPTIFVTIRFWSRAVLPVTSTLGGAFPRFWWDDWTCLIGLALHIATISIELKLIDLRHLEELQPEQITELKKLVWVTYFTFTTGTAFAKSSAIFFYERIFSSSHERFRYALWVLHALNAAWLVGTLFALVFQCWPIAKVWNAALDGECASLGKFALGNIIPSIIIDVFILLLPLPILWRLQMELDKKVLITAVFVCGYLTVVVSFGQLITISKDSASSDIDFSYNTVPLVYWDVWSISICVMSVSLPNIFSFMKKGYRDGLVSLLGPIGSSWAKLTDPSTSGRNSSTRENSIHLAASPRSRGLHGSIEENLV